MPGALSSLSDPPLHEVFAALLHPKTQKLQHILNTASAHLGRTTHRPTASAALQVEETTLYEFVTNRTFLIDRRPFDWPTHQYLVPLYQDFVLDQKRDGLELVVMKGAQVGMSIFAMLALLFVAVKFPGSWLGYYLPDREMADIFSHSRFRPLLESNRAIAGLIGNDGDGENRKRLRNIGPSTVVFGYLGGVTSTESSPMLGIFLDEVRRMDLKDIALVEQRISHSPYPINVKLSTAGYPDNDIDAAFRRSDQRYFHTNCACPDGVILADIWPECIGIQGEDIFYRCPRCATRIMNPQHGRYIAHAPSHFVRGYHIPQTLSLAPLHTPAKLWEMYTNPKYDQGEFVRSVLGRPYVAPEAQLVTSDDLKACEEPGVGWMHEGTRCAMGIDHMGGWLDVVILTRTPQGKLRLAHLERIEGDDPFGDGRLDRLMQCFDISCCVCDLNPNFNEAMRFGKRWAPRVFLATYSSSEQADMIAWRDRQRQKDQQASEAEVKFRFMVCLQRYKILDYALGLFRARHIILPHPRGLIQEVRDEQGVKRPVLMGEELFWPHMQRIVRHKHILDKAQGTYKMEMIKVGADPHYAFAFTYAVVAANRHAGGRVVFV